MWWWNFTRIRRLRLWRDALGLSKDKISDVKISRRWSSRARLTFRSGSLTVRITAGSEDKVRVLIEGAEGFSILKLYHQLLEPWKQEIEIGDEKFDARFLVEGPVRPVSALLDAQLRSQLLRASADCDALEIGDGRLEAEVSEEELLRVLPVLLDIGRKLSEWDVERQIGQNARWDPEAGVRLFNLLLLVRGRPGAPETLEALRDACSDASPAVRLRAATELGEIAEPLDVKSRLLHNARRDPKPEVRLFNLLALIREYPGDPDTLKVLRGACLDPISKVRVRAAIELGEEGHNVLLRIVEKSSDDAARALAVSHLGSKLSIESVKSILSRALHKGSLQTARACLEWLGRSGDAAAFDALAEVLALEKGELAPAAALALGATGPAAEPLLLQALQSEDGDLRMAAAEALGRVGSVVAVLPLQEATGRFALDPGFCQVARRAIAEIQSRLQGAAPGQLSLAEAAGQLSLAAEAGQLSLTEAEAGQLSLAVEPFPLPPDEPEQPSPGERREPVVRRV